MGAIAAQRALQDDATTRVSSPSLVVMEMSGLTCQLTSELDPEAASKRACALTLKNSYSTWPLIGRIFTTNDDIRATFCPVSRLCQRDCKVTE